jgi:NAD(P)-dependent dehydrogenase (short-subunit alcohol dehydrogenase family)
MLPFAGVYNASKAAAAAIAETFRTELAPFGIRTVNLLTGAVKTNFGPNRLVKPTLPPSSIYSIAKEEAQRVMDSTVIPDGSDAVQWAEGVVADLSRKKPAYWIWRGKLTTAVWLAGFLPVGGLDFVLGSISGLGALGKRIKGVREGKDKIV